MDIILEREGVDTSRQVISRHMSDGGTTRVYTSLLSIVNVAYFTYSYLWASPNVLITTETVDDEGNELKFDDMDEILKKASAIL